MTLEIFSLGGYEAAERSAGTLRGILTAFEAPLISAFVFISLVGVNYVS